MSVDPSQKIGKNLYEPQRWNRYVYTLNNPLKYFDPDGLDVTVAAKARGDAVYAYQHSKSYRKQFDAAKANPDVKVTLTKVPTVANARAQSDLTVTPLVVHVDSSGNTTSVEKAGVEGTVATPEKRGDKLVPGAETAALQGHELTHINNLAGGVEQTGSPEAVQAGQEKATAVENDIKDELGRKDDDISKEEAEKAIGGTEPKKKKDKN